VILENVENLFWNEKTSLADDEGVLVIVEDDFRELLG